MNDPEGRRDRRRMEEIEDRRIEILLELAEINDDYGKRVSRLRSEYARLTDEYDRLWRERIEGRDRTSTGR